MITALTARHYDIAGCYITALTYPESELGIYIESNQINYEIIYFPIYLISILMLKGEQDGQTLADRSFSLPYVSLTYTIAR